MFSCVRPCYLVVPAIAIIGFVGSGFSQEMPIVSSVIVAKENRREIGAAIFAWKRTYTDEYCNCFMQKDSGDSGARLFHI